MQVTPSTLRIYFKVIDYEEKMTALVTFLRRANAERPAKCIVYFDTCASVDYFTRVLACFPGLVGIPVVSLHGKVPGKVRTIKKAVVSRLRIKFAWAKVEVPYSTVTHSFSFTRSY